MRNGVRKAANVVDLFEPDQDGDGVGRDVIVGRPVRRPTVAPDAASINAIDLSGQPKVIMAIGLGATGKTTFLRWVAERALEGQKAVVFAAVDPENRELPDYFEGVQQPPSYDPTAVSKWVEQFLMWAMKNKRTAVVDFGGGDTLSGPLGVRSAGSSRNDGGVRRSSGCRLPPV